MSAVVGKLLEVLFLNKDHDPRTAGIALQLHSGEPAQIWVGLGPMVADEAALHFYYSCKGAGGLKPCILCANVFNRRYRMEGIQRIDATKWACFHDEADPARLVLHTKATVDTVLARVAAPGMSKRDRQGLETDLGWSHNPQGLMQVPALRELAHPVEHCLFDWMHVFFVNGIWNNLVYQMRLALRSAGVKLDVIGEYLGC